MSEHISSFTVSQKKRRRQPIGIEDLTPEVLAYIADYSLINFPQPIETAYKSFTPALMGTGVSPTLGTGSTAEGRYVRIGRFIHYVGAVTFGTSGASAGSGDYHISLPAGVAPSPVLPAHRVVGISELFGTGFTIAACSIDAVTNAMKMTYASASPIGTALLVTESNPWAWAENYGIYFSITYEAA